MTQFSLNLPPQLKQAAEYWAIRQDVSLNEFITSAVAEKVGSLERPHDDPAFPQITYRRGASGIPIPVLQGTGIRVQTIAIANTSWNMNPEVIAEEYGLPPEQIKEALAFFEAHRSEIETHIAFEEHLAKEMDICGYFRSEK
ncbi:MAG: DUF433 domain-containing protein [Candidatus Promineifilaceae bacterium]